LQQKKKMIIAFAATCAAVGIVPQVDPVIYAVLGFACLVARILNLGTRTQHPCQTAEDLAGSVLLVKALVDLPKHPELALSALTFAFKLEVHCFFKYMTNFFPLFGATYVATLLWFGVGSAGAFLLAHSDRATQGYAACAALIVGTTLFKAVLVFKRAFKDWFNSSAHEELGYLVPAIMHLFFLGPGEVNGMMLALTGFGKYATDPASPYHLVWYIADAALLHGILAYRFSVVLPKLVLSSAYVNLILLSHRLWFFFSFRQSSDVEMVLTAIAVAWDFALLHLPCCGAEDLDKQLLLHYGVELFLAAAIYYTNCFNHFTRPVLHLLFVANIWTFNALAL